MIEKFYFNYCSKINMLYSKYNYFVIGVCFLGSMNDSYLKCMLYNAYEHWLINYSIWHL